MSDTKEESVNRINEIKAEITTLTNELMKLADKESIFVHLDAPFHQARGAGGMTYYGKGHESRYDDDYSYCKPDDYGGWRSSATDMC